MHTHRRDLGLRSTGKQQDKEGAAFNWQIFVAGLHSGPPKSPSSISLLLSQSAPLRVRRMAQCINHPRHSSHLGLSARCGEWCFQSGNIKNKRYSLFHWHQQKRKKKMPIEPKGLNSIFQSLFYGLPKLWEKIEICLFLSPFLSFFLITPGM